METLYDLIALPAVRDPGKRGLAAAARPDLRALAQTLCAAPSVLIVTGFPIRAARIGETDGPCGAAALAHALCALGKRVTVVTDALSAAAVHAACALRAPQAEVLEAPCGDGGPRWCAETLARLRPAHILAIERPGKGADGHYHNSRGQIIDELVADTDALLDAGLPSTAVGDGGNELGMGALRGEIARLVPHGAEIAAVRSAGCTVTAGVSNWGGWTICAALSVFSGRDLLPTEDEERALMRAVVAAGAVDGITALPAETVDGLPLAENLAVLRALRLCAAPALRRPAAETLAGLRPAEARLLFREGGLVRQTSGMCAGYTQCNLIVLPAREAADFRQFAARNPFACPVLEETAPGARSLQRLAQDADAARDFPLYRVYEHGRLTAELPDVAALWRDDFVAFFIGCSFSFEDALLAAGLPVRHIEENRNVPMYLTNIPCAPAGMFHGSMVVSMRPMTPAQAERAREITARMPRVHGAPVHMGDPARIGIADLDKPDFGERVTVRPGEIPVFWPCGVTPQAAVMAAKPAFAITHAPGHMFICDIKNTELMDSKNPG